MVTISGAYPSWLVSPVPLCHHPLSRCLALWCLWPLAPLWSVIRVVDDTCDADWENSSSGGYACLLGVPLLCIAS